MLSLKAVRGVFWVLGGGLGKMHIIFCLFLNFCNIVLISAIQHKSAIVMQTSLLA